MPLTDHICCLGVQDDTLDLFESQFAVPHGVTYNSYLVLDDHIAVIDAVDARYIDAWMANLASALNGRTPDYLIVQHMEPDHSAGILAFADAYPHATIIATAKAFAMMKGFFGVDFANRRRIVTEGDTLELGGRCLRFITAPMVHWPEVIVTYDSTDRVLFSADAFGRFGPADEAYPWADEARRYYFGIVGKYGAQVQTLLKKISALAVDVICPLHGPALHAPLDRYLQLYSTWASYQVEEDGTLIACSSIYGNTTKAAQLLAEKLRARTGKPVVVYDLARCDVYAAIADAFRFPRLVLACASYNADIFPPMRPFLQGIAERGYQGRTVALMENGTWAPSAAKVMRRMLEGCKTLTFAEHTVTIQSALNDTSAAQLEALADELAQQ